MGQTKVSFNDVKRKGIGILGMGVSSLAVVEKLKSVMPEIGKSVPLILRDKSTSACCPLNAAEHPGLVCRFGENWLGDIEEAVLFRSPVIRPDLPPLKEALQSGVILTSEIAWTMNTCPARCFAVTGSDGKTSTVSMLYAVLSAAEKEQSFTAYLGGNIGVPLLASVDNMAAQDYAVFELSSFQLLDFYPKSQVATILNVTENHLDVHKDMAEYIAAKTHIFENANRKVIQAECPYTADFLAPGDTICSPTLPLPLLRKRFGRHPFVWLEKGTVNYTDGNASCPILSQKDLKVKGKHQLHNAMTTVAMLYPYVSLAAIQKGLSDFSGVAHRMEKIATIGSIDCYDSAIDTTPARVEATLSAFSGKPTVICGGSDKGLDYTPLGEALLRYAGRAVVSGATGEKIASALKKAMEKSKTTIPLYCEACFVDAVKTAFEITPKGGALLLSPGSASFDEFANYKAKSHAYRDILKSMGAVIL